MYNNILGANSRVLLAKHYIISIYNLTTTLIITTTTEGIIHDVSTERGVLCFALRRSFHRCFHWLV